ncbi:hypothetical protein Z950_2415 [Sulfitobacter mediterraneus KCTC 32188]|nr:hypothetical protein Z950_2415 [Sulfitobacter mediterraneus KCTC 32188]
MLLKDDYRKKPFNREVILAPVCRVFSAEGTVFRQFSAGSPCDLPFQPGKCAQRPPSNPGDSQKNGPATCAAGPFNSMR